MLLNEEKKEIENTHEHYRIVSDASNKLRNKNMEFAEKALGFIETNIESVQFTGRVEGGKVDAEDALSINVIEELNSMKKAIVEIYSVNVNAYISDALSSAEEKDVEEYENTLLLAKIEEEKYGIKAER